MSRKPGCFNREGVPRLAADRGRLWVRANAYGGLPFHPGSFAGVNLKYSGSGMQYSSCRLLTSSSNTYIKIASY